MSNRRTSLALAASALLCVPLWALAQLSPQDRQARLDRLYRHPDKLARLQQDLQAFLQLSGARREQLAALDEAIHDGPPEQRKLLRETLRHYVDWLDGLPDVDRQAIEGAPTSADRLARIKEVRDREWMQRQPQAQRRHWASLEGEARAAFVQELRREERLRRLEWGLASRFWKELEGRQALPVRAKDFDFRERDKDSSPPQVLIEEYLWPLLSDEEKQRLEQAEGHWPRYPATLVQLADRHPFALPGKFGPRTVAELPREVQARFISPKTKEPPKFLKQAEGKWPGFAAAAVEMYRKRKASAPLPNELWVSSYDGLLRPMREFVDRTLQPQLDGDEKLRLLHAHGTWPKYPQTIEELSRAHGLQPPWHTALPGPRERWDAYRTLDLERLKALAGRSSLIH